MVKRIIRKEDLGNMEFIKMPAALMYDSRYKNIKAEGKLLYGILLNLITLSIEKGWINKDGEPFVKLSRKKMKEILNIGSTEKVAKVVKELREYGLIDEKSNTISGCNEIYLYIIEENLNDIKFMDKAKKGSVISDKDNIVDGELSVFDYSNFIDNSCSNVCSSKIVGSKSLDSKIEAKEVQKMNLASTENRSYINNNYKKNNFIKNNNNNLTINNIAGTNNVAVVEPNFEFGLLKPILNFNTGSNFDFGFDNDEEVNSKVIKGFEKTEIETVKEIYGNYYITDKEAENLLKVAGGNLYTIDLAHEQAMVNFDNVRNFIAYNIAIIKNM